jgi:UDP-N-acetylglucosamine 1-carboxyvinyltransferase
MGAEFKLEEGYIIGKAARRLQGAEINLAFPSVGATENLMLAATLAEGVTTIRNAAREPEIADLARFLNLMGAQVSGAGGSDITVIGVDSLGSVETNVMFDRIEAATLLLAGPITGGDVTVCGTIPGALDAVLEKMRESGIEVEEGSDYIRARAAHEPKPVDFRTEPFPGFPTDVQAQFMAYLTQVDGESDVQETIFENRFMHVPELNRLGADIRVSGNDARIYGKRNCLKGATVMATDLRASASLVIAALSAEGKTKVRRIYHLDRGYESIEKKLEALGAHILREKE